MTRKRKQTSSGGDGPVTFATARALALELPGVVEGTSYGTPGYRAGKTLFARQHQDGESLVVRMDHDQRAVRMRAAPETFYITDHYVDYPWMLVRLATVDRDDLREILEESWRLSSPKHLGSAPDPVRKSKPAQSRKPPGRED